MMGIFNGFLLDRHDVLAERRFVPVSIVTTLYVGDAVLGRHVVLAQMCSTRKEMHGAVECRGQPARRRRFMYLPSTRQTTVAHTWHGNSHALQTAVMLQPVVSRSAGRSAGKQVRTMGCGAPCLYVKALGCMHADPSLVPFVEHERHPLPWALGLFIYDCQTVTDNCC